MPKISVLIPVYNTEKYIVRCLDSILNQSFRDIEVIVVNDATPDNSMDIVRRYANNDSRIKIIDKRQNEGSMAARKSGYERASGKYIIFCDSDDYYLPESFRKLYDKIESTNADVVVGGYRYIPTHRSAYDMIPKLPYGNESASVFQALLNSKLLHNLWANIYRRSLFEEKNYLCLKNATRAEDLSLFYEIIRYSKQIETLNDVVYAYCQNRESSMFRKITKSSSEKMLQIAKYWRDNSLVAYPGFENEIDSKFMEILLLQNISGNSECVWKLLETHPKFKNFKETKEKLGICRALIFKLTSFVKMPLLMQWVILRFIKI